MALNKSKILIRDYEDIRQVLRHIYIYGCFSKEDYVEKLGISERKYDEEQRRISAYLPEGFIHKEYVNKKVMMSCSYNILEGAENYLADTYRNKTFKELDIMTYFFVQQLLHQHGELTKKELLDKLPHVGSMVKLVTKENLRKKLEELEALGLITSRKMGNKVVYALGKDRFADFEPEELQELCTYLEFLKNVSPMEIPYHFLYQKLKLYLLCEKEVNVEGEEVIQFKHNHLFNSLDNDVMLEILKAIKSKKTLKLIRYGFPKENVLEVIPAEIIHDSMYGRQYLCCCNRYKNRWSMSMVRLENIFSLSCDRELTEEEIDKVLKMKEVVGKCWCTSNGKEPEVSEIVIEFRFDEENEAFILRRIQAEGHGGSLQKKEPGVYEYRLSVLDPDEMIPWIRSFGERAKVLSSGVKQTRQKLAEDWKKAVAKYEALQ